MVCHLWRPPSGPSLRDAPVIDPVWALLEQAYAVHGVRPTLLERDFNFPPIAELYAEVAQIRQLQAAATPLRGYGT